MPQAAHDVVRVNFRRVCNEPFFIESHETRAMHELMASTLDEVLDHSRHSACRAGTGTVARSTAPTDDRATHSQGWSGPKEVDGQRVEDFWRSHQVPVSNARGDASSIRGDRDTPRCRTVGGEIASKA